ncbi:MAG: tetratricopeptide repeat protein [Elusimicrobia bacterium]|nr:tetratricopeptide repeat protein [Elusimicrobiota bacterium]
MKEAEDSARGAFLAGRLEDAEKGYQYLLVRSSDSQKSYAATVSLASLAKDQGHEEEALALWVKATLLSEEDPFAWNQRAWSYLALGRYPQARQAFQHALAISTVSAFSAEARLGLAMAEWEDAGPRRAAQAFEDIFGRDAILLSFEAQRLGDINFELKKYHQANQFFKQALVQDPLLLEGEVQLGKLYEKMGLFESAWQAYWTLWNLDPGDSLYQKWLHRVEDQMRKKPQDLIPWRRIGWPLLTTPQPSAPSPLLRVLLFSDPHGTPTAVREAFFISPSDFRLVDEKLGSVVVGKKNSQWQVRFNPDFQVYEVRSNQGQLEYSTRQPFRIEPITPGSSVLLKSIVLSVPAGVDGGDRELRGVVEFRPHQDGMIVVDEIYLEDYLLGAVSHGWASQGPPEAFKAKAVALRTKTLWLKANSRHPGVAWHLCDSSHCSVYSGLQQESVNGVEGAKSTVGQVLYRQQEMSTVELHLSCGGLTEEGVQDSSPPRAPWKFPGDLERWVHSFPTQGLYCQTSSLSAPGEVGWVRLISVEDIMRRQNRRKKHRKSEGVGSSESVSFRKDSFFKIGGDAGQ